MKVLHIASVPLLSLLALLSCSKQNDSIVPQRKNIIEAVYASGTIHADNEYKTFANANGLLQQLHVHEGDLVTPQQTLFEIESKDVDLRAQSARESLRIAEANAAAGSTQLRELIANIENTRAKYVGDSLTWSRNKELLSNGSVSRAEFDRVNSAYESSRAIWQSTVMKYESTKKSLNDQITLARNQMLLASTSLQNFTVQSRLAGRVYAVYKEVGEMVSVQQPVMLIGDDKAFTLRLVIDASDVARVKPGQKVLYTVDAFADSAFSATVTKILPVLESETQSFRVDATCDKIPPVPFVGTQVQANIVCNEKSNALVIPRAYVQPGNQVFVREGSSTRSVQVSTGISNLEYIEILSGINEHATIVRTIK